MPASRSLGLSCEDQARVNEDWEDDIGTGGESCPVTRRPRLCTGVGRSFMSLHEEANVTAAEGGDEGGAADRRPEDLHEGGTLDGEVEREDEAEEDWEEREDIDFASIEEVS